MHIPETIKNALLVFVVIMLVYVLYQRLLIILGKKKRDQRYVTLGEKVEWIGKIATIEMTLYMEQPLSVLIFDQSGKEISKVADQKYLPGHQFIEVDCSGLSTGRYYFRINAPAHVSSVYFNID
jgi:hypothetical protein